MAVSWKFLAVGKPRLPFAAAGVEEYLPRLKKYSRAEVDFVKPTRALEESAALLKRSQGCFRLILDERGETCTSREFAEKLKHWQEIQVPPIAVLIGGADGHDPILRESADFLWSLSPLTLQHEMALVLCLEQVYRAYSILNHSPYHRD